MFFLVYKILHVIHNCRFLVIQSHTGSHLKTSYNQTLGTGTTSGNSTIFTASQYTDYANMVLAVVRSRAYVQDIVNAAPTNVNKTTSLAISGNSTLTGIGDLFGTFKLTASSGSTKAIYNVSLNPDASSFLPALTSDHPTFLVIE